MNRKWIVIWIGLTVLSYLLSWLFLLPNTSVLLQYYVAVSLSTGLLYSWDKLIAPSREAERVPEYLLLVASVLGASLALLVISLMIRHKIRKRKFQFVLLLMTIFHGLVFLSFRHSGVQ